MIRTVVGALLCVIVGGVVLGAQRESESRPAFEVASATADPARSRVDAGPPSNACPTIMRRVMLTTLSEPGGDRDEDAWKSLTSARRRW
jgi:hypothetical protein